ncbi:MAG: polysaccharide pyruvyl transferase family protein [Lachnospiraceae bacterium]|nr:polysaccharide pyruvyl transferase family protein [Lachnospiraceae bacterium]
MNTLILGVLNSTNLGDPVIVRSVEYLVRRICPQDVIRTADLTGAEVPDRAQELRNEAEEDGQRAEEAAPAAAVPSVRHLQLRSLRTAGRRWVTAHTPLDLQYRRDRERLDRDRAAMAALLDAQPTDRVIVAGGQMLMDSYALYVAALIRECEKRKIEVILNACGTGPLCSRHNKRELTQALESPCVRLVSVRDGAEKVRGWGVHREVIETCDAALYSAEVYPEERSCKAYGDEKTVGLGPIYSPFMPLKKEIRFWKKLTALLDEKQIPWVFFCNGSPEDYLIAGDILQSISTDRGQSSEELKASHLLKRSTTPEELLAQERQLRGLISFRLHSHIIAASLGLPSVGLIWDQKLPGFFRQLGAEERSLRIEEGAEKVLAAYLRAEQEGPKTDAVAEMKKRSAQILEAALRKDSSRS